MAANTIVTTARQSPVRPRTPSWLPLTDTGTRTDPVARAAARTAPRGPGLATVIALPVLRPDIRPGRTAAPAAAPAAGPVPGAPELRAVPRPARRTRSALRVAALGVIASLLVAGFLGTVLTGPEEPVAAGHVVLQPGETLWDIAIRSAPAGVDPRRQLEVVRRLNGFGPGALDAWTVVLIPAP